MHTRRTFATLCSLSLIAATALAQSPSPKTQPESKPEQPPATPPAKQPAEHPAKKPEMPTEKPAPKPPTPPAASATAPAPRDDNWKKFHQRLVDAAATGGHRIAFLGDSITEGWAGAGKPVWEKTFAPLKALNVGIGGDRTQHVLWRLDNGLADALAAKNNDIKLVVLMIGTNNSNGNDHTGEEIGAGIARIVATLRAKLPAARVLVLGIFPRGEKPDAQRKKNATASAVAAKTADNKYVYYLDIGERFLEKDGTLTKEVMPDALHLSEKGYQIWADAIEAKVKELAK